MSTLVDHEPATIIPHLTGRPSNNNVSPRRPPRLEQNGSTQRRVRVPTPHKKEEPARILELEQKHEKCVEVFNTTLQRQKEEITQLRDEIDRLRNSKSSESLRRPLKQSAPTLVRRNSSAYFTPYQQHKDKTRDRGTNVFDIDDQIRPVREKKCIVAKRETGKIIRTSPYLDVEEKEYNNYEKMRARYAKEYAKRQESKRELLQKKITMKQLIVEQCQQPPEENTEEEYENMINEYNKLKNAVMEENFIQYRDGILNYRISGHIDSVLCFCCENVDVTTSSVTLLTEQYGDVPVYREMNMCQRCRPKRDLTSSLIKMPQTALKYFKPL